MGIKLEYVSATGDACPAGSYTPKLSDDGRLFSVAFTKFRPKITPANKSAALACRLAIVVSAPVGTSFQVDQFSYGGYTYLEEGVKADLTTTYYFQADQSRAEQLHTSLTGPQNREYHVDDKSNDNALWSPCGTTTRQTLNVQLHVGLTNSTPARDGTFEVNEAVGIALRWRKCETTTQPDAGAKPDAGSGRAPLPPTDDDDHSDEDRSRSSDEDRSRSSDERRSRDSDDWDEEDWDDWFDENW